MPFVIECETVFGNPWLCKKEPSHIYLNNHCLLFCSHVWGLTGLSRPFLPSSGVVAIRQGGLGKGHLEGLTHVSGAWADRAQTAGASQASLSMWSSPLGLPTWGLRALDSYLTADKPE